MMPARSLCWRDAMLWRLARRLAIRSAAEMPLPEISPSARAKRPSFSTKEVVVVATDCLCGAAVASEIDACHFRVALGEEAFLNLAGDLDLAGEPFPLGDLRREIFEELGIFEGEAGL
jgi:hypothetical protein